MSSDRSSDAERSDFIRDIVAADVSRAAPRSSSPASPRSPMATCTSATPSRSRLNFGIAREFGGRCHLRFDDTNPAKEEQEYIDAIQADVRWLGADWGEHLYYASDYFEQLYAWAGPSDRGRPRLRGRAVQRADPRVPRHADRARHAEPLARSSRRRRISSCSAACATATFPDGGPVLRARIDMASPNINMRDPVLYRIVHAPHPRTGDAWCIYPTYDFAHGQSDAIEGITHSICTLEFENHRPLYDWLIEHLPVPSRAAAVRIRSAQPHLHGAVKRFLKLLVDEGRVRGWDDPRMPTISGLRRRGYPAKAIRDFAAAIGVSKRDAVVEIAQLEHAVRDVLNRDAATPLSRCCAHSTSSSRTIPTDQVEEMDAVNNPEDAAAGTRQGALLAGALDRAGRLHGRPAAPVLPADASGREVRLRYAYLVTCTEVDQGCGRRDRRAALHLRPGHARR